MQKQFDFKNIKKIALISAKNKNLDKESQRLKELFFEKGFLLNCIKNKDKLDPAFIKNSDLLISLGGDGTLISLGRKSHLYNKPILGINAGTLGFLTTFSLNECLNDINVILKTVGCLQIYYMLELILQTKRGKILRKYAFNEAAFLSDRTRSMINISTYENNKLFNHYKADALIIATAAGSTAYNMSANGPIIHPNTKAFVLTPVCSHSLTQKSVVLPKGFLIDFMVENAVLYIDGQELLKTKDYQKISIGLSNKKLFLVQKKDRDYFQILKEKLHWGER